MVRGRRREAVLGRLAPTIAARQGKMNLAPFTPRRRHGRLGAVTMRIKLSVTGRNGRKRHITVIADDRRLKGNNGGKTVC